MMVAVTTDWLQSVVGEELAITQQLQSVFSGQQLRLYSTTIPFPVDGLTSQEQAFFETLKHPNRQASWLLGRTILKFFACHYPVLLCQGNENPIDTLAAWQFPHPRCSLSHTENIAYGLVNLNRQTTASIGLDIEAIDRPPLSSKALGYLLSETERANFEQLQMKHPETRWDLRYWTAKEACYKATPMKHQNTVRLSRWQLNSLSHAEISQAHVQTATGDVLKSVIFQTCSTQLKNTYFISIAFVG
jgi:phosphopantetheinyl transferase (holo-ACP synthase)